MDNEALRELHLYDLETLLADLVVGKEVATADGPYSVSSDQARSALDWYRRKGVDAWNANVNAAVAEEIVEKTQEDAPAQDEELGGKKETEKKVVLRLKSVVAHRFAGLHNYGTPSLPPKPFTFEFGAGATLFEGRNGSGKTSLANAIIWALTGELLRAQREPQTGMTEFDCLVDAVNEAPAEKAKIAAVTPLPDVADYQPDAAWIPADTWVELTFEDEKGNSLKVKRSQKRTSRGKLEEKAPDLSFLGLDPIAFRIGTTMPGLLQHIRVGTASELGKAVSQLTGLSALVDLANHARRVRQRIDKELTDGRQQQIQACDEAYSTAKNDLEDVYKAQETIRSEHAIPAPSKEEAIEETLRQIQDDVENKKALAFSSAQAILGETFDPKDMQTRTHLEDQIRPALSEASQVHLLPSMSTLKSLGNVSESDIESAKVLIRRIAEEAQDLLKLSEEPELEARIKLYARIAAWIKEFPQPEGSEDNCAVCSRSLLGVLDPVTGESVSAHLGIIAAKADLLGSTLKQWEDSAITALASTLPLPFLKVGDEGLPDHPSDLIRVSLLDELFSRAPFQGVLGNLKSATRQAFEKLVEDQPALEAIDPPELPDSCGALRAQIEAVLKAIQFVEWRHSNDEFAKDFVRLVLGSSTDVSGKQTETLVGKLQELDRITKAAQPLSKAADLIGRLQCQIELRRKHEKRLKEYVVTSEALSSLMDLGELADKQVDQLRTKLSDEAAHWRRKIYLGAFPSTAHELVDAEMGRKGELSIIVKSGGVAAPAQHVANASALRASLVAFYLAFWKHVYDRRGGLRLLVLDDPQELLDQENSERLARTLSELAEDGVQLVAMSYERRFAEHLARTAKQCDHREVLPATKLQKTVRTIPHRIELQKRKAEFENDQNDEEAARNLADTTRVYLEAKLGDIFEDPAFSSWVIDNPHPALNSFVGRLRREVRTSAGTMFSAAIFGKFCDHSSLVDGSDVLALMNKSHHGRRSEIRAADVAVCKDQLDQLASLAEQMFEECCRWRKRDVMPAEETNADQQHVPTNLKPLCVPQKIVPLYADLAAFTDSSLAEGTQAEVESIDFAELSNLSAFQLRRDNFGFSAPAGAIALAETESDFIEDRRLVISRHIEKIYARRLLRPENDNLIALSAEALDPTKRCPKTVFFREGDTALHRVVGVIFDHDLPLSSGNDEAYEVAAEHIFERASVAFRVRDNSAIPLALPGQIVIGAEEIESTRWDEYEGRAVALCLSDGSAVLKRAGRALSGSFSRLRQFESLGGLGASVLVSTKGDQDDLPTILTARLIYGVLYKV